jgi:hypothetical protein
LSLVLVTTIKFMDSNLETWVAIVHMLTIFWVHPWCSHLWKWLYGACNGSLWWTCTFCILLIFQRMVSEIIKCNRIFLSLSLSVSVSLLPKSICVLCTPDVFVNVSLLTAWGFLEHQYLFNVNHASSQKNTFCLPVLVTTTCISFLVPKMEERLLVCLKLHMAVVLRKLLTCVLRLYVLHIEEPICRKIF